MQERSPAFIFGQVLSHMTGKKNVAAVAAIHHPLCRVDAASGYVGAFVYVHYTTDRPTVNAHSNLQARIVLERAADLHCTLRRFLRTLIEHKRDFELDLFFYFGGHLDSHGNARRDDTLK